MISVPFFVHSFNVQGCQVKVNLMFYKYGFMKIYVHIILYLVFKALRQKERENLPHLNIIMVSKNVPGHFRCTFLISMVT